MSGAADCRQTTFAWAAAPAHLPETAKPQDDDEAWFSPLAPLQAQGRPKRNKHKVVATVRERLSDKEEGTQVAFFFDPVTGGTIVCGSKGVLQSDGAPRNDRALKITCK